MLPKEQPKGTISARIHTWLLRQIEEVIRAADARGHHLTKRKLVESALEAFLHPDREARADPTELFATPGRHQPARTLAVEIRRDLILEVEAIIRAVPFEYVPPTKQEIVQTALINFLRSERFKSLMAEISAG